MDFDSWKPAEKASLKCSATCNYYKLTINGVVLIEIDPINMIRNVNGSDQLSKLREALPEKIELGTTNVLSDEAKELAKDKIIRSD